MSWLKKYKLPEYQIIGTVPFAPMAPPAQNASNNQVFSLSQPEPTIHFSLTDPRKTRMTTGQKINPNVDLVSGEYTLNDIDTVLKKAKAMGLSVEDAYNLAAMDLQETGWGNTDSETGHALYGKGNTANDRFLNVYTEKMKEADRLKIKDPMLRIQMYNGMGVVTPKTEKDYHGFEMQKIYGVPIPQGGISMRKNPLYGKQIVDLRDNVLKKNPNFVNYINSIYKPAGKKDGGWLNEYAQGGQPPVNPNGMYDGVRDWRIPGGNITMKGVPFPVLAKASNGMSAIMQPGGEYNFPGASHVDEYPMYKFGGSELKNGGWLDEYQDGGTEYIVKKGDTLGQIGKQFGMTPQQIADANDISDINFIRTNQKLNIPGAAVPQQPITGPADIPVASAQFQNTTPSFTQRQSVDDSVNIKNNPELYSDLDPEISSIISNYTTPSTLDNEEDIKKRETARRIVEVARQHIAMGKKGYFEVPPDVAAASLREGKEPAGCVGGACKIAQEAGAMPKVFWSNTAFTKAAPELGFPNKGYGLRGIQNLEPGDFLTHQTELGGYDEKGNPKYIPRHTQIFLGINPQTKQYEFFDNYHKRLMSYSEDDIRDKLKQTKNSYDYGAVIYKMNPFHPTTNSYTDETVQQAADKELFVKEQMKNPSKYKYSIRSDAKDYDNSTKGIMNTFVNYANDDKNITDLVSKLKVGKDEIHDSLLNVFGELGQENNWSNSGKGLKSKVENVAEKVLTFFGGAKKYSVGPGQNKFSTIPEDLREQFGIKSPKDLYDINKVIPLMVAEDIRNKQVLRRWGQQNVLSHKLIGHTDKENPLRADDLKGGVGRWSPYLRNEFGLISSGKRIINNNDLIPWNGEDVTWDNWYNPGAGKLVSNYDMDAGMFMNPRTLAEGSYPDKVFHKTDDNLQRTLTIPNTETSPDTLPTQYVFSKAKPKKAFGGEIGWLNNYK